jgi:hypothetical protein
LSRALNDNFFQDSQIQIVIGPMLSLVVIQAVSEFWVFWMVVLNGVGAWADLAKGVTLMIIAMLNIGHNLPNL